LKSAQEQGVEVLCYKAELSNTEMKLVERINFTY
jgi:sugar fermentation stimulation protein A